MMDKNKCFYCKIEFKHEDYDLCNQCVDKISKSREKWDALWEDGNIPTLWANGEIIFSPDLYMKAINDIRNDTSESDFYKKNPTTLKAKKIILIEKLKEQE